MKKNTVFLIAGLVLTGVLLASTALAQNYGLEETAKAAFGSKLPSKDVSTIIGNILGTGLAFISVFFFILMIYGGILYMTARGKDDVAKKAIDTIWAAIIGALIVLSAYALTNFVFNTVDGTVGGGGTGGGTTPAAQQWTHCGVGDQLFAKQGDQPCSGVQLYACTEDWVFCYQSDTLNPKAGGQPCSGQTYCKLN